jgi:putative oxidoreductase
MARLDSTALLLGRILIALLFLPSGIGKLTSFDQFAASLATKGLPLAQAWAVAAIAIEMLAPIFLVLGIAPRMTALALVAFVIMATWTSHQFWTFADAAQYRLQKIMFFKNVAIIGGLLLHYAHGTSGWSLLGHRQKPDDRA